MKRVTLLCLPLAFALGCHKNLIPDHDAMPSCKSCDATPSCKTCVGAAHMHGGAAKAGQMGRRFANVRSQIAFVSPVGMKIGWESSMGGGGPHTFMPAQLTVPGRYNFDQGAIYRLKTNDVPGHPGVPFYPTLEVAPSSPRTDAYLTHNAIPIEFTDEDFDQVSAGNFVSKVIYLPDPQHQELAIAGVETLVSTLLDPGVDPVAEADRRGTILAIVRIGGIDLEMPQAQQMMNPSGAIPGQMPNQAIMMADQDSSATYAVPQTVMHEDAGRVVIQR